MLKAFKKLWNDERGNALIIAGAALPLLVGSAGLATDTIQWTLWKRQLQRAADSAAIAGVYQRVQGGDETVVNAAVDRDLDVNQHTGITLLGGYPEVDLPADSGDMRQQVDVVLAVRKELSFSSLFLSQAPMIRAHARAASVPGSDEYCVVSLESTSKPGITIGGNAKIDMNCGMISNSPAFNSALSNGSSSTVKASVIAAVGGVQASNKWDVEKYDPYVSAIQDPYGDINPNPADMKCAGHMETKGNKTEWVYDELNENTVVENAVDINGDPANCWTSISISSSGNKTLPSGTYYINGGDVSIHGDLSGEDVTIVLTNSDPATDATIGQLSMESGATLNIDGPGTGTFKGIALFQDRRAEDKNQANKINGNSASIIEGAVYFPSQQITYNGDGTSDYVCTRIVGRRVEFSGNTGITNKIEKGSKCPDFDDDPIQGGRRVRLVA